MKMGKIHRRVHDAFCDLKRPFDPVDVYTAMCKLLKLGDDSIERGIGKLYTDKKLEPKEPKSKKGQKAKRPADDLGEEDFA